MRLMSLEGVNSSLSPVPLRPILLPVDKCGIQAQWQACRGETAAVAFGSGGPAAITDRRAKTEACQCAPAVEAHETMLTFL